MKAALSGTWIPFFSILEATNQKATFFVVGWMAERHPEQIKRIANNGHEIGSHTHLHQLVYQQTAKQFQEDLKTIHSDYRRLYRRKSEVFSRPWVFNY